MRVSIKDVLPDMGRPGLHLGLCDFLAVTRRQIVPFRFVHNVLRAKVRTERRRKNVLP